MATFAGGDTSPPFLFTDALLEEDDESDAVDKPLLLELELVELELGSSVEKYRGTI